MNNCLPRNGVEAVAISLKNFVVEVIESCLGFLFNLVVRVVEYVEALSISTKDYSLYHYSKNIYKIRSILVKIK